MIIAKICRRNFNITHIFFLICSIWFKVFVHLFVAIKFDCIIKWIGVKAANLSWFFLQINDAIYYESLPVCDYLDEAYPGRKLLPDTPEERVKDKMALTHYDMVIWILMQPFFGIVLLKMLVHFNKCDKVDWIFFQKNQ